MKKSIFKLMALTALVGAVSLTSCKKEDPAKAVEINVMEKTAVVSGTILVDSEVTDSATYVNKTYVGAPQQQIIVRVKYSEINSDYESKDDYWQGVANITDGKFSITIPVGEAGATPEFILSDSPLMNHATKWERKPSGDQFITVKNGYWMGGNKTGDKVFPKENKVMSTNLNPWHLSFVEVTNSGDKQ